MEAPEEVLVLGAGVNGLSCALGLLAAGVRCRVWTRDPPSRTTSRVAAALWYPYAVGPAEAVARWAPLAYRRFAELAASDGSHRHGVRMRETLEMYPADPEPPAWRTELEGFRPARGDELPEGLGSGWVYRTPVIDTALYIPFLIQEIEARGGHIETRACQDLAEALADCDTVINTTGLGARELCGDQRLQAVRGQLVRVQAPAIERALLDEHRGTEVRYVVPLEDGCILGGSVEPDRERLELEPEVIAAIARDCGALDGALVGAPHLETRVGLRPCRDEVRLELEQRPSGRVVHNYGHGGAGVTLSWGCAAEALSELGVALPDALWLHESARPQA